jgi:8-oxo-dGTP diphosphatase
MALGGAPGDSTVDVAVAVLQRPDGAVLLAKRPKGKVYAGYWEFPGVKVVPG